MSKKDITTELEKGKTLEIKIDKVQMKKLMELRSDDTEGLLAILKDCDIFTTQKDK